MEENERPEEFKKYLCGSVDENKELIKKYPFLQLHDWEGKKMKLLRAHG